MKPIDTATGLQDGTAPKAGTAKVLKGYLVTLPSGWECRLAPDKTRALAYAVQQRAKLEPLYVERDVS